MGPSCRTAIVGGMSCALVAILSCTGARAAEPTVHLERAVLFTCGVAYYNHRADVVDDQVVSLSTRIDDINDLLKSLVVRDLDGGTVSSVNFPSDEPAAQLLSDLAVDLTDEPTVGQLLSQLRGHRIEIRADRTAEGAIVGTERIVEGTIVGIEVRPRPIADQIVETEWVNVDTTTGLQSVLLDDAQSIRLLDDQVNADLHKALAILQEQRNGITKSLRIHFQGKGKRRVAIGYIRSCPVWKVSYRLVLDAQHQPLLQGWAIVQNESDLDWQDVQLTLISGRPISFVMELYAPLYTDRPMLLPDLNGAVAPQLHQRATVQPDGAFGGGGGFGGFGGGGMGGMGGAMGGGLGGFGGGGMGGGMPSRPAPPTSKQSSLADMVSADEVGRLFRYDIQQPVTIARNESAMLPIVNQEVKCDAVLIFNKRVHPQHPLNGLTLTNTTDLHLMQGPITIFDDRIYAGDARINYMAPRSAQLVSYAVALDTTVGISTNLADPVAQVSVQYGKLVTTSTVQRTTAYTIDYGSSAPSEVIVEQPIDAKWKLLPTDALQETTTDLYRFRVPAPDAQHVTFSVREQQATSSSTDLERLTDRAIPEATAGKQASNDVQQVLQELADKRQQVAAAASALELSTTAVRDLMTDQQRVRENMKALHNSEDLYKMYVKRMTTQESELASLQQQVRQRRTDHADAAAALEAFLNRLKRMSVQ